MDGSDVIVLYGANCNKKMKKPHNYDMIGNPRVREIAVVVFSYILHAYGEGHTEIRTLDQDDNWELAYFHPSGKSHNITLFTELVTSCLLNIPSHGIGLLADMVANVTYNGDMTSICDHKLVGGVLVLLKNNCLSYLSKTSGISSSFRHLPSVSASAGRIIVETIDDENVQRKPMATDEMIAFSQSMSDISRAGHSKADLVIKRKTGGTGKQPSRMVLRGESKAEKVRTYLNNRSLFTKVGDYLLGLQPSAVEQEVQRRIVAQKEL